MTNNLQILRLIVWKVKDPCMSVLHPAHGMLTHSEIGAACSPLSGAALRRNEVFAQNFQAVAG